MKVPHIIFMEWESAVLIFKIKFAITIASDRHFSAYPISGCHPLVESGPYTSVTSPLPFGCIIGDDLF
jgi:hypothetical protein